MCGGDFFAPTLCAIECARLGVPTGGVDRFQRLDRLRRGGFECWRVICAGITTAGVRRLCSEHMYGLGLVRRAPG